MMGLVSTMAFAVIEGFELTIPHTGNQLPTIDADLSDPIWSQAPSVQITWLNDPLELIDAKYFSTAMAAYDATYLYVAIRNPEPNPGQITTNVADHDGSVWTDDMNEICMNPRNDSARPFYKLTVTAANVTSDSEVGGAGGAWEPNPDTAANIGADNWSLEVRIPLEGLGISGSPMGQTWNFNITRHTVTGVNLWSSWTTIGASFNNEAGFGTLTFGDVITAVASEGKLSTTWGRLKMQ